MSNTRTWLKMKSLQWIQPLGDSRIQPGEEFFSFKFTSHVVRALTRCSDRKVFLPPPAPSDLGCSRKGSSIVLRFASDRICAHRVAHFCGSWVFTISDNGATQVSICYDTLEPLRLMIVNNIAGIFGRSAARVKGDVSRRSEPLTRATECPIPEGESEAPAFGSVQRRDRCRRAIGRGREKSGPHSCPSRRSALCGR